MRSLLAPLLPALAAGALTMTVTPPAATLSPTTFTVSWSGAPSPQSTDWVAQYCVGGAEAAFGPWSYVSECAGWASGSCSLQFTLSDPLAQAPCASVMFAMYRDPSPYTYLGETPGVPWNTTSPAGDATPRHTRLAYGASPASEMHLSWTSNSNAAPAVVLLGLAPGAYTLPNVTAAAAESYTAEDSCGAPSAWRFPGYFHHALLTGLQPATRYYALPTQGGAVGVEASFVTGKPPARDTPVRAIVYADMGISGGSGAVGTAARAAARAPSADFLLHIGDIAYGEGNVGVWETFMGIVEPLTSVLPYAVSIGNRACPAASPRTQTTRTTHSPPPCPLFAPPQTSTTTLGRPPRTPRARAPCTTRRGGMAAGTLAGSAACPPRAAFARLRRETASSGTPSPWAACTPL